jgi:glycosyltransferase involved in cell wall biosynthesis
MIEATAQPESAARVRRDRPRIALAHDWLCGFRGGEAVLERLASLVERDFEPAGLYVIFDDGRPLSPEVDRLRASNQIRSSWLTRLPGGPGRLRRWLFPLYPSAVGELSCALERDHARAPIDLLVSSSSAAIKGLRPPAGVPHLCYCHSPARYVWSRRDQYGGSGPIARSRAAGLRLYAGRFKRWDRATAGTVSRFIANSAYTSSQIRDCFGVEAAVVHPPVRTAFFTPDPAVAREKFWLVVSALEPYKRVDLAIAASREARVPLVIVGDGSQRSALERLGASGVQFKGRVSDEQLRDLYRRAALLAFPQTEDFGIAAAEAIACGLPVVALAQGGALDIVEEGFTGSFFAEPVSALIAEAAARAPRAVPLGGADRFSEARFDREMLAEFSRALASPAPSRY